MSMTCPIVHKMDKASREKCLGLSLFEKKKKKHVVPSEQSSMKRQRCSSFALTAEFCPDPSWKTTNGTIFVLRFLE